MMLADWRSSLEIGSKASNRLDKYVEGMRWLLKTNRVSGSVDSGCDLQETRDLDGGFDDGWRCGLARERGGGGGGGGTRDLRLIVDRRGESHGIRHELL
jgi:hypothetical protein